MTREEMERSIANAGWELDGGFSDRLLVGNAGDLAILAHEWAWQNGDPAYELYDVERHLSCWVKEVPKPRQAAELLEEHGGPPEEEPELPPHENGAGREP